MYCKNCGKKIRDGAEFCSKCGCAVEKNESAARPVQLNSEVPSTSKEPEIKPVAEWDKKNEQPKTDRIPLIFVSVVAIAALATALVLGLAMIKNSSDGKSVVKEETAVQENVVIQEEALTIEELAEPEEAAVLPTQGVSDSGTTLMNIVYNSDGTIASLDEVDGVAEYHWEYVYNSAGQFIYRTRYSEKVPVLKSSSGLLIPNTDITYKILAETVRDCVGFVFDYRVLNYSWGVSGNINGDRWVYIAADFKDKTSWENVGRFEYDVYSVDMEWHEISIKFDEPKTLGAFGTPRVNSDDSSFDNDHVLKAVWLADYNYAAPV